MAIVLDKEKKEALIKGMLWELKRVYKGIAREVNNLNDVFIAKNNSGAAMNAIEGLEAYLQRIRMYERKFDITFEQIKLLFKLNLGTEYDSIMEDSVIKYCRGQIDYIEYFIMKGSKQIFKKFKA